MATSIEKLAIQGIRSYSPNQSQAIEFFKPLTLIVGKNGCGKTTIIESLKMATTGELPPNCKNGQAFINDPNVFNTTEVKAQIKLKYVSASGKVTVCCRSFSLVQKPTKKEYKAFEAALQVKDNTTGKNNTLSYKAAELNKLVPEMMGVSPAILESVVFVHQEDSCWPLSDDATLKKKFDDIFAATDYTKALDEINKVRKAKVAEVKVLKAELDTEEEKLATANRLRQELQSSDQSRAEITAAMKELQERTDGFRTRLERLFDTKRKRDQLRNKVGALHSEHQQEMRTVSASRERLQVLNDSELAETTEELREVLTRQNGMASKLTTDLDAAKKQKEGFEASILRAERSRDEARTTLAAYRATAENHRELEVECGVLIATLSASYDMAPAALHEASPMARRGHEAVNSLKRVHEERSRRLAECKDRYRTELRQKDANLQQLRIRLDNCSKEAAAKEVEASQLQRKESQLKAQADAAQGDEALKARHNSELQSFTLDIRVMREDQDGAGGGEELNSLRRRVKTLKDQEKNLVEELQRIDKEGDKQQKFRERKAAHEEKKERFEAALRTDSKIRRVLGRDADLQALLDHNSLEREVGKHKHQREQEREQKEREARDAANKLEQIKSRIMVKTEHLVRTQGSKERIENELKAVDMLMLQDDYDFDGDLRKIEQEIEQKHESKEANKSILSLFERAMTKAETDAKCMMCDQACGEGAKARIKSHCETLRNRNNPQTQQANKLKLAELNEKLNKRKRAAEEHVQMKRMRTAELPALTQEVDELKAQQSKLKEVHGRRVCELDAAREAENEVLRLDVSNLRALHTELRDSSDQLEQASAMQSAMFNQLRSKDAVTREWEEVQSQVDSLERKADGLDHELRTKEADLQDLLAKKAKSELELHRITNDLERQAEVAEQLKEVGAKAARLKADAHKQRNEEQPLSDQLRREESELKELQSTADAAQRELEKAAADVSRDADRLGDKTRGIERYQSGGDAQCLVDATAAAERAQQAVTERNRELKELTKAIEKMNATLHSKDKITLQLQANIELREARERSSAKQEMLLAAQHELQQLEGADRVDDEVRRAEEEINKGNLEHAKFDGMMRTVAQRAGETKTQLNEPKYRSIDNKHRKKLIEYKTVQMAAADLERYHQALDRALMKFHSTKMEDINKQVKELWNKTYKGTDIDSIEIHSEHEGENAAGARKHTYRVQMYKGGAALDMRGRCSAGQKVLACLIIRLALAETFCLNCGILALDEPTTNLDKPNVEAFAQALNEIIKNRKQQSNFQLVVITHDEDFVQLIGRSENCSHYYRISKEFDNPGDPPVSKIERHSIDRFG